MSFSILFQVRLEITLGHLLDAVVVVASEPHCARNVVLEFAVLSGEVVLLTNVSEAKDAHLDVDAFTPFSEIGRRN